MPTRSLLATLTAIALAAGCGAAEGRTSPGGGAGSTAGAPTTAAGTRATSTTVLTPPPAAEIVTGFGPTDCPADAVVARARPAAPSFPRGGATVTIYVTLTSSVDCRWHPMEFWRPFADVLDVDGARVWREAGTAPGTVAAVTVQLRAGQEVLVHTAEWDQHPHDPDRPGVFLPLAAAGRYAAVATVEGIAAAEATPFEVVA